MFIQKMLSTLICIFILTFSKFAKAATTASENLENVGDNIRVGEIVETAPEPEPMISGRDLTAILGDTHNKYVYLHEIPILNLNCSRWRHMFLGRSLGSGSNIHDRSHGKKLLH